MKCLEEGQVWDSLRQRLGDIELARRIERLPSYRAYISKYPFDGHEPVLSLDALMESDQPLSSMIPDVHDGPEEEMIAQEIVNEFEAMLTVRQKRILGKLKDGWHAKDFYQEEGYKNTGGIRYHRHMIRKKLTNFSNDQPHE